MANKYITLEEAKWQLNIDADWQGDDSYIEDCIDDAVAIVAGDANRDVRELEDVDGELIGPAKRAALLKIGDLYNFRESVVMGSVSSVPGGYDALITQIKRW